MTNVNDHNTTTTHDVNPLISVYHTPPYSVSDRIEFLVWDLDTLFYVPA